MAEVKWTARRVSDVVLVDVTGDTDGVPATAPTANALEAGSGEGVIASDGSSPIGSMTTLFISDSEPPAQGEPGNLWLQTDPNDTAAVLTLWVWTGSFWERAGRGDSLEDNDWRASNYSAAGAENGYLVIGFETAELNSVGFAILHGLLGAALQHDSATKLVTSAAGVHIGTSSAAPGILSGAADPAAGAGVAAPVGSLYLRTNGTHYAKTSAPNTGWVALATV